MQELGFINSHNKRQIESFCSNIELVFYLPGDLIIKQGTLNQYFYVIIDGMVEVMYEHQDFEYFDHKKVEKFVAHQKQSPIKSPKTARALLKEGSIDTESNEDNDPKLTNVFLDAIRKAKQVSSQIKVENFDASNVDIPSKQSHKRNTTTEKRINLGGMDLFKDSLETMLPYSKNTLDPKMLTVKSNKVLPFAKFEENKGFSENEENNTENLFNLHLDKRQTDTRKNMSEQEPSTLTLVPNKNYTILNELEKGKSFGEVSLLTNLSATASVHTITSSICARLQKDYFLRFLDNYPEARTKIEEWMNARSDPFFKNMHRIMENVPLVQDLGHDTIRSIIFSLRKHNALKGQTILHLKEISNRCFFIYSGVV